MSSSLEVVFHLSQIMNIAGNIIGNAGRDSQPASPVTPLPIDLESLYQPLGELPQKADLIALPSALLRVNSQLTQPLPVCHFFQGWAFHLGDEAPLDRLQQIDGVLVPRRPQLATVVQSWLDEGAKDSEHEVPAPPPECPQGPASHAVPRLHSQVDLLRECDVSADSDPKIPKGFLLLYWATIWSHVEDVRGILSGRPEFQEFKLTSIELYANILYPPVHGLQVLLQRVKLYHVAARYHQQRRML